MNYTTDAYRKMKTADSGSSADFFCIFIKYKSEKKAAMTVREGLLKFFQKIIKKFKKSVDICKKVWYFI